METPVLKSTINYGSSDSLTQLMDFFSDAAVSGWHNLMPHAIELVTVLAIIDLAIVWSLYKGEFRLQEMIEKTLKYSLLFFFILNMGNINYLLIRSFQMAGLIAGGITPTPDELKVFAKPSGILQHGLDIIGVVASAKEEAAKEHATTLLGHLHEISIFSSGGMSDALMTIIAIVIVCFVFFTIAIELMMTIIEFNIFASIAVILLPFGALRFTSFLFQRCISAVFQFGIKMLVIFFLVSLTNTIIDQAIKTPITTANGFGPIITQCLIYLALAYLVKTIPNLISGMLSGQPSMSGTGVSNAVSAVPGAVAGGVAGAVAGAARNYGSLQAVRAAAKGYTDTNGKAVAGIGYKDAFKSIAANKMGKQVLRGADVTNENLRKGKSLRDGSYKYKTDEQTNLENTVSRGVISGLEESGNTKTLNEIKDAVSPKSPKRAPSSRRRNQSTR